MQTILLLEGALIPKACSLVGVSDLAGGCWMKEGQWVVEIE